MWLCFFSSTSTVLVVCQVTATYRRSLVSWVGLKIVFKVVRYFLRFPNVCCCYRPKANVSTLLRVWKKGRLLSADLHMNMFIAARRLANFCTCFLLSGGCMLSIALIFFRFSLIPFADTRHLRIFPIMMLNTQFFGMSLCPTF